MSLAHPSFDSNHSDSSSDGPESDHGVGLSDPLLSQARRRMLDLVNRLHNTGFVSFYQQSFSTHLRTTI
jgi:hypothetical protein